VETLGSTCYIPFFVFTNYLTLIKIFLRPPLHLRDFQFGLVWFGLISTNEYMPVFEVFDTA